MTFEANFAILSWLPASSTSGHKDTEGLGEERSQGHRGRQGSRRSRRRQMNLDLVVGAVIGGVIVLLLELIFVVSWAWPKFDKAIDTIKRHIERFYEPKLYAAMFEMDKQGSWTASDEDWYGFLDTVRSLGLYRISRLRKCVDTIHARKEDRFEGAVEVKGDWTDPKAFLQLERPAWFADLLGGEGRPKGSIYLSPEEARSDDLLREILRQRDAVSLLLYAPNRSLVREVRRAEPITVR